MRLDVYLYTSGYASSRQRASCLIKEGLVRVEGKPSGSRPLKPTERLWRFKRADCAM